MSQDNKQRTEAGFVLTRDGFSVFCFLTSVLCCLSSVPCLAQWEVYQQGHAVELALDKRSLWLEDDGLVHFVDQERFSHPQFDKFTQKHYSIRRTVGYADCQHQRYALVSTDFYNENNRHIWSTLYPVPRYSWVWQVAKADSVAATMLDLICRDRDFLPKKSNK